MSVASFAVILAKLVNTKAQNMMDSLGNNISGPSILFCLSKSDIGQKTKARTLHRPIKGLIAFLI